MSTTVDQAFIDQFESDVKIAYQREGSKLGNTVRNKKGVTGQSTTFQKAGKGTAGKKSRHGLVPLMNIAHAPVKVTLEDFYAGDYVDKLDELKTNIDERQIAVGAGVNAIGRKVDDLIVQVARVATGSNALIVDGGTGLTQAKANTAFERFGMKDVPDDGKRYFAVSPDTWTDLLGITAFSSSDYIPAGETPYQGGMVAKRWLSFMWFGFSGLSDGATATTTVRNLAYHETAIGLAFGQEVKTDITWVGERQANFIAHSISTAAIVIDDIGIQCVDAVR
jgi:hypothetical protein